MYHMVECSKKMLTAIRDLRAPNVCFCFFPFVYMTGLVLLYLLVKHNGEIKKIIFTYVVYLTTNLRYLYFT